MSLRLLKTIPVWMLLSGCVHAPEAPSLDCSPEEQQSGPHPPAQPERTPQAEVEGPSKHSAHPSFDKLRMNGVSLAVSPSELARASGPNARDEREAGRNVAVQPENSRETVAAPAPVPAIDVAAKLKAMTVEQKVGQLMMIGFGGQAVDAKIVELVKGLQVGGICIFKRNIADPAQLARFNDGLRELLADIPPFIAVDQEGGNVVRIPDGVTVLPGNMALGATRSARLAWEAGKAQGEDLKRLGFNMNLAPVLDVNLNPQNPVIGSRSFSDQVSLVSAMGVDFVRGQQEANIVTIAKHFPGHGSVDGDSHKGLPVLEEDEGAVLRGLEPFLAAMKVGLDGVMTAHIAVPNLTGDVLPATMSRPILTGLLRERLGFGGLVVTDELEMEAINEKYGVGKAAVMAVNAGADMVLIPWRAEKKTEVHAALLEAVKSGELSPARLDEAVGRILSLKLKRGVFERPPPLEQRMAALGSGRAISAEIARNAVTLLRADGKVFPLRRGQRVAVVTPEASLATAVAARAPGARTLVVPSLPRDEERQALKLKARKLAEGADLVIVGVVNARQLELVTMATLTGKPVVVVVMGVPYLAAQLPDAPTLMVVYSYRESATEAAAGALFGEHGTPGKLPVSLQRMPFGFGIDPVGESATRGEAAGRP